MSETYRQGFDIMNRAEMMFNKGCVEESLNNLVIELNELRKNSIKEQWQEFAATGFLKHQISELIHQDPFTNHSFIKPRNYSGDAELVDYMYRLREPDSTTTDFGKALFECTTNAPAPQSVRARKSIIASMIDELAESSNNLRIFSIACGHLREAFISEAVLSGRIEEFFALDQDPLSLEIVRNELSEFNVKPIHASIKSLFTNGHEFQNLDFIYSAGLYDYLPQSIANKLTAKLFTMLKSGGRLLVANFAPCLRDIGYMETFMKWKLIYREENEVADFARLINPTEIADQKLFWDEPHNVIYLQLIRA